MYTGKGVIPQKHLQQFIRAADFLQLLELKQFCIEQVPSVLKPENVISWFRLAGLHSEMKDILILCSNILFHKFDEVCKGDEYTDMHVDEIATYLSDIKGKYIDPDDVLDSVIQWMNQDLTNRCSQIKDVLLNVELGKCSLACLKEKIKYFESLHKYIAVPELLREKEREISSLANARRIRGGYNVKAVIAVIVSNVNDENPWFRGYPDSVADFCRIPNQIHNLGSSLCKTPDGFIMTGEYDATMYIAETKTWRKLNTLRTRRFAHGSLFVKGNLIISGGYIGHHASASVELFNMEQRLWHGGPNLPNAVMCPEMSCIDDDVFLLDTRLGNLFCMDARRTSWDQKTPPGINCSGVRMIPVKGQLCVVGGRSRAHVWYTPSTDTWSQVTPPIHEHVFSTVLLDGEDIVVLENGEENKAERYNLGSKSWSAWPLKMPGRLKHVSV